MLLRPMLTKPSMITLAHNHGSAWASDSRIAVVASHGLTPLRWYADMSSSSVGVLRMVTRIPIARLEPGRRRTDRAAFSPAGQTQCRRAARLREPPPYRVRAHRQEPCSICSVEFQREDPVPDLPVSPKAFRPLPRRCPQFRALLRRSG